MPRKLPKPRIRVKKPFSWLSIKSWYCTSSHPWARTIIHGTGDTPEKAYSAWKEKWESEGDEWDVRAE